MSAAAWRCQCGYANLGVVRCGGCRRPNAGLRRQLRRRRVVASAVIAVSVMAAGAKWSPARSAAKAALAPPPTTPAPTPPPHAQVRPAQSTWAPAKGSTRVRPQLPISDRCTAARQAVEAAGDHLGAGFDFRCPATDFPRWGATTLSPCGPCSVDINTALIGPNNAELRYVVAHEFCHSNGIRDEQAADDCAARYGFPNVYFKR